MRFFVLRLPLRWNAASARPTLSPRFAHAAPHGIHDERLFAELHAARARLDWTALDRLASEASAKAPQALATWAWSTLQAAIELAEGHREVFGDAQPVLAASLRAVDAALSALAQELNAQVSPRAPRFSRESQAWLWTLEERAVAQFSADRMPRTATRVEARALRAVMFAAAAAPARCDRHSLGRLGSRVRAALTRVPHALAKAPTSGRATATFAPRSGARGQTTR